LLALSEADVKKGIFGGPQIRKVKKDAVFTNTMNGVERQAHNAFTEVAKKFPGNVKDSHYALKRVQIWLIMSGCCKIRGQYNCKFC
jgi:hypothetical protein